MCNYVKGLVPVGVPVQRRHQTKHMDMPDFTSNFCVPRMLSQPSGPGLHRGVVSPEESLSGLGIFGRRILRFCVCQACSRRGQGASHQPCGSLTAGRTQQSSTSLGHLRVSPGRGPLCWAEGFPARPTCPTQPCLPLHDTSHYKPCVVPKSNSCLTSPVSTFTMTQVPRMPLTLFACWTPTPKTIVWLLQLFYSLPSRPDRDSI